MASDSSTAHRANAPSGVPGTTRFAFQHRVFGVEGVLFALDRMRNQVVFRVSLGGAMAAIPLASLMQTFDIAPDSEDAKLIKLVERGLKFVREIRPGDSIPNEVLDGTASWKVEPHHNEIARSRLLVQLVSWMTGSEDSLQDPSEALVMIEQPEIKEKVNQAFEEAAEKLGFGGEGKQKVIDMIDQLAREMAFIEALREKVSGYLSIERKLKMLAYAYRGDRSQSESIQRVQALVGAPFAAMRQQLTMVDGQTAEIISALKRLGTTIDFVRTTRDKLRESVLLWDEIGAGWNDASLERGEQSEQLIVRTYRFVASHFSLGQRWSLNVG